MQKIWFIDVDGKLIGPFSVSQLRSFPGITPDTLVWREGFKKSLPIRFLPELRELFEDAEPLHPEPEEEPRLFRPPAVPAEELALDMGPIPPFWVLVFLLALIVIFLFSMFK